jgi:hypothetical protein
MAQAMKNPPIAPILASILKLIYCAHRQSNTEQMTAMTNTVDQGIGVGNSDLNGQR